MVWNLGGGSFCEVGGLATDISVTHEFLAKATVATHYT